MQPVAKDGLIFNSSSESHEKHNGAVTIVRALTASECDAEDVGPMFLCRDAQSREFHAFEDELS